MKLRRSAICVLIFGSVLLLVGILMLLIPAKSFASQQGTIGIIGGADGPTARFLTWKLLNGWPVMLILLGLLFVVSATVYLVYVSKRVKKNG